MVKKRIRAMCLVVLLGCMAAWAGIDSLTITPTAYGSVEVGQVGKGYNYSPSSSIFPLTHVWQQRAFGNIGFAATYKQRLLMNFAGEGYMAFSAPQIGDQPQTLQTRSFFYVKRAFASYSFGDINKPVLSIQAGYFPYKYNPDVRNLGENLFRTNAYPLLVYSSFDYPQADLLGLKINVNFLNNAVTNDLILHSEFLGIPTQDWSLSDVISIQPLALAAHFFNTTIPDAVTIGGGVSFAHLFSVYQGEYPNTWTDYYFNPHRIFAYVKNGDSTFFDWKALKVMGRISVDPKKFMPDVTIFGKNDLNIYAEVDVAGWKNYDKYFAQRDDRTLTSLGFNIPTLKILDVFNIEAEYCPNTSAFSDQKLYSNQLNWGSIAPVDSASTSGEFNLKRAPWRWSVYAKKSILDGHVSFIGQVARDHKKINYYYFQKAYMSLSETLPTEQSWWWTFKTEFSF